MSIELWIKAAIVGMLALAYVASYEAGRAQGQREMLRLWMREAISRSTTEVHR